MLKKLVDNSNLAIKESTYEISEILNKSNVNLSDTIKQNEHASIITEIKFSSPSFGTIRKISDPVNIAKDMVSGGAIALSVLTQPYLFDGSPDLFMKIRREINIPMLMKDIIVDFSQIEAGYKMGADYILLIQSLFDQNYLENLDGFIDYAHKKNLGVLLEVHTKEELKNAQNSSADIIGINNRNLDTLDINLQVTKELLSGFTDSRAIISESGIENPEHINFLKECGANGFLIGSRIMKENKVKETVHRLVNAI
ncbi:MAG: indole-3-glycerol-phosphate synthase [Nitrosopumilaceae archaeon]|nr:indole-3-glycerol-phosphate synthase [Nitrosopumilaceae archaeon]NIU02624.1 indole-3-glycerol-phosphate synthase [Nitrosopumilaceae archaeon]NIU89087.1 indole-3-glycerol-phosphate synthase [Nitrosopumilaceae archaeon]NIV67190.1 indole-3-glycerol-phosphate synthase [Nitrosopumilaceae archaeon]NIX63225.1 indole-3-glycerol-phosphate synthase [Nitrosopumilaceae archaeon]